PHHPLPLDRGVRLRAPARHGLRERPDVAGPRTLRAALRPRLLQHRRRDRPACVHRAGARTQTRLRPHGNPLAAGAADGAYLCHRRARRVVDHPVQRRPVRSDVMRKATPLLLLLLAMMPSEAFAHIVKGEAIGFVSGFEHPISGLDHIIAMVAVGLWGAQLGAPAIWLLPVTFP